MKESGQAAPVRAQRALGSIAAILCVCGGQMSQPSLRCYRGALNESESES